MANPISELLKRRVPQIVGLYLVGCWGFVEFTDWAVEQYVLSPHVTNFVVIALLSLLPSVLLLAWRFGAPGDDQWTRTESIAIPLNVIASAALLFFVFTGKDLGAATTTVVVEDAAGNEVEREIPKREFRKRVLLFSFDNKSGDAALDWLSHGAPLGITMDLGQQSFVIASTADEMQGGVLHDLREAGFPDGVGVPLTLKRDVAERRHVEHFVSGSFTKAGDSYTFEYQLYETRRARQLASQSFTGTDVFALFDQMSEQLRRDLDVPAYRIEESTDLPVSELTTSSVSAFKQSALATHRAATGDIAGSIPLLESAVEEDPTFAWAQAGLAILYLLNNQQEEGKAAMEAAQQHLYRLPERYQLAVRTSHQWLFEQNAEKALSTAKYWAELYPDDIQAHARLAQMFTNRAERDKAIGEYLVMLELDPTQYDLLRWIGNLYGAKGEHDTALEYFQRYADQFPDDYRSYTSLAGIYREMGEHDLARSNYDRALVVEPDEPSVMLQAAGFEMGQGDFERVRALREQALAASKGPEDLYEVYQLDEALHYRLGQYGQLKSDYDNRAEASAEFMDPVSRLLNLALSDYLAYAPEAGRETEALRELDGLSAQAAPPFDGLLAIAYLAIYDRLEEAEKAREQIDVLNSAIDALGFEALEPIVTNGLGRIAEIEGDCEEAIAYFNKTLEINPGGNSPKVSIARCQLTLGDAEAAEATLTEVLARVPAYPQALYQMALVYEAQGRTEAAISQLDAALEIWKDADPEYIPAREVREKLAELQSST